MHHVCGGVVRPWAQGRGHTVIRPPRCIIMWVYSMLYDSNILLQIK